MILFNPELRRNIWLDFSIHRVTLTSILIWLILHFFYLSNGLSKSANVAFNLACFFIFLWGAKNASETVIEEVNNNTWDFQRQASTLPWSMAWGKLIGSTLFSWFATFICLVFYVLFSSSNTLVPEMYLLIVGGLFTQALTLLLSIQPLAQIRRERTNKTFRYFVAGAVIGAIITHACFLAVKGNGGELLWHGWLFNKGNFAITSILLFLVLTTFGLQRTFCKELQYRNIPWAWTLFNIFCIVYFSGFATFTLPALEDNKLSAYKELKILLQHAPYYAAFSIGQLLTYFALFTETLDTVRYKKIITRYVEKNVVEFLEQIPWWSISFILMIITGTIAVIQQPLNEELLENFSPSVFILTCTLFLFRDILLTHYFYFSKNPKRAVNTAVVYLLMLYILIPLLFGALHLSSWLPLLLPSWGQNTLLAIISSLTQILFLFFLCFEQWKLSWKQPRVMKA
ncbi:MAG: hypothetical protein ACHQJ6_00290 [Candidatus Berkiellales bacterium]